MLKTIFDTSVLIEMIKKGIFKEGNISVISLIEILRGVDEAKRVAVKEEIEKTFGIININNDIILTYCNLYNHLRRNDMTLPDADLLIAATVIAKKQKLITKDRDFERLRKLGLNLIIG